MQRLAEITMPKLRRRFLGLCLLPILGYMVGASTWLLYGGFRHGHEMFCGLSFLTAAAIVVGIRWGWRAEAQADAPVGVSLPCALRWSLIVALSGIAIYINL